MLVVLCVLLTILISFLNEETFLGSIIMYLRRSVPIVILFYLVFLVVYFVIAIGLFIMGLLFFCIFNILLPNLGESILFANLPSFLSINCMIGIISPDINADNYISKILLVENDLEVELANLGYVGYNSELNQWLPLVDFEIINPDMQPGEIIHTARGWECCQSLYLNVTDVLNTPLPLVEGASDVTWPIIEEIFNDPDAFQTLMNYQLPAKCDFSVLLTPRLGIFHPYWNPLLEVELFDESFNMAHITSYPNIFPQLAESLWNLYQML